jgi:carbon monoxide dehydrogenase subunit G
MRVRSIRTGFLSTTTGGGTVKRMLALVAATLLLVPLAVSAKKLTSEQSIEINAPPDKVWAIVKDFDGLAKWHPAFKGDVIKSGKNNEKGAVRTLTLGSGESFDEELLSYNDKKHTFRYKIIGDSPFPIVNYVSSMSVGKAKGGKTRIVWQGQYDNKPGSGKSDQEVVDMLNGAYKAGLENVKKLAEQG